ncbi:MAG: hypothetical protein RI897_1545 [Verrucomicrobiota bacterium]
MQPCGSTDGASESQKPQPTPHCCPTNTRIHPLPSTISDIPSTIYHLPSTISHLPSTISHIPYPISHIPYPISHIRYPICYNSRTKGPPSHLARHWHAISCFDFLPANAIPLLAPKGSIHESTGLHQARRPDRHLRPPSRTRNGRQQHRHGTRLNPGPNSPRQRRSQYPRTPQPLPRTLDLVPLRTHSPQYLHPLP